jgi:hypothetical protein
MMLRLGVCDDVQIFHHMLLSREATPKPRMHADFSQMMPTANQRYGTLRARLERSELHALKTEAGWEWCT